MEDMKENKIPKTIYKYRAWESYGKTVLENFELYLASPKDFNDPFDAKIPDNFIDLSDEELEKFVDNIVLKNASQKQIPTLSHSNPEWTKMMMQMLKHDPNWLQNIAIEKGSKAVDDLFGIISFSAKWDNILMWGHYGNNHAGYCIGFNEEKIRNSGFFGHGGLVMYPEDKSFPKLNPLGNKDDNFYKKAFTKSFDWKYEEEYRLMRIFNPFVGKEEHERIFNFEPNIIDEVILGMKMEDDKRTEIKEICSENKIPLFEIVSVPFKFQLDKRPISF